jgi:hypothetical protein
LNERASVDQLVRRGGETVSNPLQRSGILQVGPGCRR